MTFKVSIEFTDDEIQHAIQAVLPNMCDSCKAKAKAKMEKSEKLLQSDFCFMCQRLIEGQLEKMADEKYQAALKECGLSSDPGKLPPGN